MNNPRLSVVIPCYNEEMRVGKTLLAVDAYLKRQNYEYEVVLVADGPTDHTVNILQKYAQGKDYVKVLARKENRGKGYTVKEGMLAARGQIRLFMDADSATTIDEMDKFWQWYDQKYDLVVGSRHVKGAVIEKQEGLKRRLLGWGGRLLIRLLAVKKVKDTQNGFKSLTAEATEVIFPKLTIDRWGFDIEVLAIAEQLKYKIKEVPIVWHHVGQSTLNAAKAAQDTLRELFKISKNLRGGKYK